MAREKEDRFSVRRGMEMFRAKGGQGTMERVAALVLGILMVFLVLNTVLYLNGRQARLRNFETINRNSDTVYLLEIPLKREEGKLRLQFFIEGKSSGTEWMLTFIECEPFILYVDGVEIFRYSNENGYQRILNASLGTILDRKGAVNVEVEVDSAVPGGLAYLGPARNLTRLFVLTMVLQTFEIGFLMAMLIYAFSLYLGKRSERYLPPFLIYVGVYLVWSLCHLEFAPWVLDIRFFLFLQSFFKMWTTLECLQTTFILTRTLTLRLEKTLNWRFCGLFSLSYAVVSQIFLNTTLAKPVAAIPYVIGGLAMVYLCLETMQEHQLLVMAFAAVYATSLISYLADVSNFVQYLYLNSFRSVPGFEILYMLTCMIVINLIFAGKFEESDILVEKLEESNRLLEETNQRLDQKVEERTALLRENEKKKRQLMMNVFHDLRSPIFVVRGYTDMIPAETEEAKKNLKVMKEKLAFLHHLTEDLFLLSKLEENKTLFCEDPVDLSELLDTLTESCRMEAAQKNITLEKQIEPGCSMIGDYFRLEGAFQNIVTNAIHYTPEGGHVEVRLKREENDLLVEVQDNGIGIPKEELDKVFQLYYFRDRSSKSASTGLGLSITQEIIRHHGGRIWAESEEGVGTTFLVRLPVTGSGEQLQEILQ